MLEPTATPLQEMSVGSGDAGMESVGRLRCCASHLPEQPRALTLALLGRTLLRLGWVCGR